jgi:mono/diheme cytochrome c family protein
MKILKWWLLAAILIQFVPYGHSHTNPAAAGEPSWNSPQTRELFSRACFDCHSNATAWP